MILYFGARCQEIESLGHMESLILCLFIGFVYFLQRPSILFSREAEPDNIFSSCEWGFRLHHLFFLPTLFVSSRGKFYNWKFILGAPIPVVCFRVPPHVSCCRFIGDICFLFILFQNVNTSQVNSLALFIPSFYFLGNSYSLIWMFLRLCHLCALLGSESFWLWELAALKSHEKELPVGIPDWEVLSHCSS